MRIISFLFFIIIQISIVQGQYFPSLHFDIDEGLPSSQVYDAWEDSLGYMWFTTDRGVSRFDGLNFTTFSLVDGLACETNFRIYPTSGNTFWVNGINGKFSYWNGEKFEDFEYNSKIEAELDIGTSKWYTILNIENNKIHFFIGYHIFSCPKIFYTIDISTGELITNTNFSYSMLGANSSEFIKYLFYSCSQEEYSKYEKIDSILTNIDSTKEILSMFIDSDENFWVGTYSGLYYFDGLKKNEILPKSSISHIYEQSNKGYWVCTLNDGVYYFSNMNIKKLEIQDSNRMVTKLEKNSDRFLFARENGESFLVENSGKKKSNYEIKRLNNNSLETNKFRSFFYLRDLSDNRRILYTIANFGFVDQQDLFIKEYKERSLCCEEDLQGNVWIGSIKGLYVNKNENHDFNFTKVNVMNQVNSQIRINDIAIGKENIWLATISHGIIFHSDSIDKPLVDSRIPSKIINGCLLENDSTLWAATNRGLTRILFSSSIAGFDIKKIENFNKHSGLLSDYIVDIEYWDNNIFLATNKGVCYFAPDSIKIIDKKPRVIISDVLANNIPVQGELTHTDNNIDIQFEGVSIERLPRDSKEFRYRLNNSQWIYTSENEANFRNMPPQSYHFEVQFRNLNHIWSSVQSKDFTIKPHYTQTGWFKLLIFLTILSIGIIYFIKREQRTAAKTMLELKYRDIALTTLRSQINPHFIFNSLNTLQNYIFLNNPEMANKFLGQFSKLIRRSLEYSKQDLVSLAEEIEYVKNYLNLEQERFRKRFDYEVNIESDIDQDDVFIPPLLTQPIIENAIKHAFKNTKKKGIINITYQQIGRDLLKIIISDNGIGYDINAPAKNSHRSLGGKIVKDRIEILNKKHQTKREKIITKSILGKGTEVEIYILIHKQINIKHN